MSKMKNWAERVKIPENIPVITPEMMEKTTIEIAKRRAGKKESPMRGVRDIECPSCGTASMNYADALTFEVVLAGERIVIPNLTGLKCIRCSEEAFDVKSSKIIENYMSGKPVGDMNAKSVSNRKMV